VRWKASSCGDGRLDGAAAAGQPGAQDCDGDGIADPNVITGASLKLRGVHLGTTVSGAVSGRLR